MNKSIILGCIVFLLAACVRTPPVVPCTEREGCEVTCEEKLIMCRSTCVDYCGNCEAESRRNDMICYTKYVREKHLEGGMVARFKGSYRDPLKCRKVTCNCVADYRVCLQSRAGIISKKLKVAPVCR